MSETFVWMRGSSEVDELVKTVRSGLRWNDETSHAAITALDGHMRAMMSLILATADAESIARVVKERDEARNSVQAWADESLDHAGQINSENKALRELLASTRRRITSLTLAAGLPGHVWSELNRIDSDMDMAKIPTKGRP